MGLILLRNSILSRPQFADVKKRRQIQFQNLQSQGSGFGFSKQPDIRQKHFLCRNLLKIVESLQMYILQFCCKSTLQLKINQLRKTKRN